MPGLDGLRAIAVLAVLAFHLGVGFAPGGLLGVGVFFTLSGYLITDLLLSRRSAGRLSLKGFWLARARRLLPALFLTLLLVTAWVAILGPAQPPDFRGAVISAVLYVNNWWQVFHHVSYFARFEAPSPLTHLWSLAIEEQFYLVWPFLLLAGARFVGETPVATESGLRPRLAGVTLAAAAFSALAMALIFEPGLDATRVYYGTDTRAFELLAGAALAMVWPSARLQAGRLAEGPRRLLDLVGCTGLLVIALMIWRTDQYSPFLYRGGFVLLTIATVAVIAAIAHPACRLGPALGREPLRWIGVRSYGIYLFHFPVIVLTTPAGEASPGLLLGLLQIAGTIALAALSWRYVEQPIRHGALGRALSGLRGHQWSPEAVPPSVRLPAMICLVLLVVAAAGFAGLGSGLSGTPSAAAGGGEIARTVFAPEQDGGKGGGPPASSCSSVIHIGDSTSEGLESENYLPNAEQRISARYGAVGASTLHFEISGARSAVETFEGSPNAETVAERWVGQGYDGCWVFALGTNDTANIAAGSKTGTVERIERMLDATQGQRVLWVNLKSLLHDGPYSERSMEKWNDALLEVCEDHPNMHVLDWASEAEEKWFTDDGIHYTTPGYAARARAIANGLANAFPARGDSPDECVVSGDSPG